VHAHRSPLLPPDSDPLAPIIMTRPRSGVLALVVMAASAQCASSISHRCPRVLIISLDVTAQVTSSLFVPAIGGVGDAASTDIDYAVSEVGVGADGRTTYIVNAAESTEAGGPFTCNMPTSWYAEV
jgi:hypothetical protein